MRFESPQIRLNPSGIARFLAAVTLFLILASTAGQLIRFVTGHDYVKGLIPLFFLDAERNIPTYFSVLLMLFAAMLLAVITVLNRQDGMKYTSRWGILSAGFLFMSFDEAFYFHERLIYPLRDLLGGGNLGVFYFAWVPVGLVLVIGLGLFFLRFIVGLPSETRFRFLTAAAVFLGGALGLEMIGGSYAEIHGMGNWVYSLIVTIEESLELIGLIVFIWALMKYLAEDCQEVRFRLSDSRKNNGLNP